MSNTQYSNAVVYANQVSKKYINEKGNGYHFVSLKALETMNSKAIKEKYGVVKSISIIVPDFAIKGAVVAKQPDKVFNLDKNEEGKVVEFDPLVLNENKEKVSGQHVLANISLKAPESDKDLNDKTKVKVTLNVYNEKEQTYENKVMTISFKDLTEDLFVQNNKNVIASIKKYKDQGKDIFQEVELENNEYEMTPEELEKAEKELINSIEDIVR